MTHTSATALNAELQPGAPPALRVATDDAARWVAEQRDALRASVAEHGALLVRGLGLRTAVQVEAVFRELGDLMDEVEAFAPRRRYAQGIYSATTWPPNQPMCVHHELSYALEVPSLMLFACLTAPTTGGATPLADGWPVLEMLPAALVERCDREGWLLIRNYNDEIGASVVDVFGTDDRAAVERYCRANQITFEWREGGGLRTWQRRSAVVRHPISGRRCWFNQIAFLNPWTLADEVREYLVDMYGEDGLPFNTRFGNGDPIGPEIVQTINNAYQANSVQTPWQAGDLLLVDNIRTAHGREPFEGPRDVIVALADPVRLTGR